MPLDSIREKIEKETGVVLYFSGEECGVCHALRPKVKALFDEDFPLVEQIYIDAHNDPAISAYFQVFAVPTLIVFLGGREFAREGRAISFHALRERLKVPMPS